MDSQVQEIKDKLSINEVVGQYVQLQRAGRNWRARCPFHKEKTPSFMVSPERGTYMCFGCGEKGDIFSFVQKMEGIDFAAALRQLAARAGVVLRHAPAPNPEKKEKDERLYEACEAAAVFFESALRGRSDVHEYLRSRGAHGDTVAVWRLGYASASWEDLSKHLRTLGFTNDEIVEAGLAAKSERKPGEIYDRFRGRIMFPLFDTGGRVIAFSGRFFEDMPPKTFRSAESSADVSQSETFSAKYVNSPETALFKKSRVLYGLDRAKNAIRKADCILLVEGQFDVVLSHQSGLHFAVALSGTALTQEHVSLLGRYSKRLVLALDADSAGIRAGLKSAHMALAQGFDVKVPTFPDGKDPADLARENPELLKAAVRTSTTAIEFFLTQLRLHAKDERMYKKDVEAQVLPLVAAIHSSIEREHFIRIVAQKLQVPEPAVRAEVARRPALRDEAPEGTQPQQPEEAEMLAPFDKKVGMLLFHFAPESPVGMQLQELFGAERLSQMRQQLESHAEELQFRFDREVGEHNNEEVVAADILQDIKRILTKQEIAAAGDDTKKIHEIARRV